MVSPVSITHQFNGDAAAANFVDAGQLDTQLGNLATTINAEILTRQQTIKDSGGLANASVRYTALHPEIVTSLAGLIFLQDVAVVAQTNIVSLSGLQTVDGYTLLSGDRILLMGQNAQVQNGIYVASAGSWALAYDSTGALTTADSVASLNGNSSAGTSWRVSTAGTPGSTATTWIPIQGFSSLLPLTRGGTGANTAAGARTNLGLGALATLSLITQAQLASDVQYQVDTIAALKALTAGAYNTVLVRGYYAANGTGGGVFVWDSANATADNGGTIIIPNSAPGTGRWVRRQPIQGFFDSSQFGAKGDGVTDDTAALASLVAQTGVAWLAAGSFVVSSTLTPRCYSIIGAGRFASVLLPTIAVTKVLAINSSGNYPNLIHNFRINGTSTSNSTGIFLGDAGSCAVNLSCLTLDNFTGATGVGLRVGDCLKSKFDMVYTNGCATGCLIQKVSAGYPTTLTFNTCIFSTSTINGCKIIDANDVNFNGCDFESSTQEGCLIQPAASGSCQDVYFDGGCWFEHNYSAGNYALRVDGSAASCLARVRVGRCYFNMTNSEFAILMNGAGCAGFVIDNPSLSAATAGAIAITNSAYGRVYDPSGSLNLNNIINDTSFTAATPTLGAGSSTYKAFTAWTPTFSSSVGNAAASFSGGAVTLQQARFKIIGKILFVEVRFTATLLAVTPSYIQFTLPGALASFDNNNYSPCIVKDTNPVIGLARPDGGNNVQLSRADFANYGSAAAVGAYVNLTIELA